MANGMIMGDCLQNDNSQFVGMQKGGKRLWRKKKESRRAAQAALIGKVGIVPLPETV